MGEDLAVAGLQTSGETPSLPLLVLSPELSDTHVFSSIFLASVSLN